MKLKSLITLTLLLMALTCVAQAQTAPAPPDMSAPFKGFYNYSKQNIIGAAEKMPAEHFSFKPTPDVRTYAELFGHILNTNYSSCAAIKGEANPNKDDIEKTAKTKDEVIKAVKASFDYCDGAFQTLTEAKLKETFKQGQREASKTSPALLVVAHTMEHYGNMITYMRMKGIVPPSTEPAPKK